MQHFALLYVLESWLMGFLMFRFWHVKGLTNTTSRIASSNKKARHVFLWGLVISAVLFAVMVWGWLVPQFNFGILFQVIAGLIIFFQICTGIITDSGGRKSQVHNFFAFGLGVLMTLLSILVVLNNEVRPTARWIDVIILVPLTAIVISITRVTQQKINQRSYVLRQQLFFGCFHVLILTTAYLGR